jgi:DNA (cytosine-5)-methyltransferase 1
MELTHFSLFTGIGANDLAAEWAGFKTVGQCEWADFSTKVLEKHWPNVPRWRDVHDLSIKSIRERGITDITLLSGGFPCQPHSVAGERKASDDERDLWGEYKRLIGEIRPKWVVGENVPGILSSEDGRFFGRILRDMAELGYNVGWCGIQANWVNAPHKRERIFIVAYSNSNGLQGEVCQTRDIAECDKRSSSQMELSFLRGKLYKRRFWPSEPRLWGVVNGIPNWMDRIKSIGNTIVPQQVYPIYQAIADIESFKEDKPCSQTT